MRTTNVKLGEYVSTSSGGTPSRGKAEYFKGSIPWIKSGELPDGEIHNSAEKITEEALNISSAKLLPVGTLMIAMYGATVGKLGILGIPAATNQAICSIKPCKKISTKFLFYFLLHIRPVLLETSYGGAQPNISQETIRDLDFPLKDMATQNASVDFLNNAFKEISASRNALLKQQMEMVSYAEAIIYDSISRGRTSKRSLGEILKEVKQGIGEDWKKHRVLGATRKGLALAKEPPGKNPQRYKPVTHGTVFYNPMRIMIGSIAFVDDDDKPGITSPDYVVLKGKEGVVDSRWFYYWLRSPFGERCIESLARGAVRERMLFNRLAEGTIELPDYNTQLKASKALVEIKPMQQAIEKQLQELELIPKKLLAQVFENNHAY